MSSFTGILRTNPGLGAALVLCVAFPLVLGLVALIMRGGGASLRPIIFLAVLMLPIAWVFLIGNLVSARELQFHDWEISRGTHPEKISEYAAWKLMLRLLTVKR